jgi:hypothetical protein
LIVIKHLKGDNVFENTIALVWVATMTESGPGAWMVDSNKHSRSLMYHEIANDGTVTPSVECPIHGCGFHEYVQLADWATRAKSRG